MLFKGAVLLGILLVLFFRLSSGVRAPSVFVPAVCGCVGDPKTAEQTLKNFKEIQV